MRKKNIYRLLIVAILQFGVVNISSAIESTDYQKKHTIDCYQNEVIDIEFSVKEIPAKPFDINFTIFFTSKNDTLNLHGFYNGGKEYVVRFCPPLSGKWEFETSSNISELNNLVARLEVSPAKEGRKGRIKVSESSVREFQYENGDKYYPIAFEADMIFALDAENNAGIPKTEKLIDDIAENGFNQLIMNVYMYDVKWEWAKDANIKPEHEYGEPNVFPFGGTNSEPNHSTLNTDFFKHLDRVIDYMDEKGVASHLMIYVWNKLVNWPVTDSEEDNRYYDYVVKRYQAFPNIIWDVSKEALAYGQDDMGYITRRINRLRELDAYNNLVTVHSYTYCSSNKEKVDFISVQDWSTELCHVMRNIRSSFPNHPIINVEHGGYVRGPYNVFPGSYTDPVINLERAYKCVFAGTYPTLYWQGASWNVIIYEPEKLAPEYQPYYEYYKYLRILTEKYDLSSLEPGWSFSNSGICLNNGNNLYVYFVSKESISIGPYLPKEIAGKKISGTWFNPLTGEFSEPIEKINSNWPKFEKPNHDHFDILILEVHD